jgi:hypothetical protein
VAEEGARDGAFEEETNTLVVNVHGALISLAAKVVKGQKLRLKNRATQQEQVCRVANLGPTSAAMRDRRGKPQRKPGAGGAKPIDTRGDLGARAGFLAKDNAGEGRPALRRRQAMQPRLEHCIRDLAVDIELKLRGGCVADADRPRAR